MNAKGIKGPFLNLKKKCIIPGLIRQKQVRFPFGHHVGLLVCFSLDLSMCLILSENRQVFVNLF